MVLLAVLYGVIAMFAGGISNALLKGVSGGLGAVPTVIVRAGVSAVTLFVVLLILQPPLSFNLGSFVVAILISILGYFPFLFFVKALRMEKVGIVAPIASSWIVVASIVGFVFFNETLSAEKLFVLVAVIAGVVLTSVDFKAWGRGHAVFSKNAIIFALAAAFLWGFVFPLFQLPSAAFGALVFGLIIETVVFLCGVVHVLITKTQMPLFSVVKPHLKALIGAGVLTAVYTPVVSLGYLTGNVSLVSALSGSSIVVAVFVASFLYKERLTVLQYAGGALILLGTIFVSVF
ncbi:DMT family transporter [Patescibacteria group bacterium]|nr:DMT family transporter [Patescibacteria group bacterium]